MKPSTAVKTKEPRADIRASAEAFLDTLKHMDPADEHHINKTFNVSWGVSCEELREHMTAFLRSI